MPVLVALSRMYRGEHHPTDVLGSLLFSALWLAATSLLIKPNADSRRARRRPGPIRRDELPAGRRFLSRPVLAPTFPETLAVRPWCYGPRQVISSPVRQARIHPGSRYPQ
jgi:hypothetical protein